MSALRKSVRATLLGVAILSPQASLAEEASDFTPSCPVDASAAFNPVDLYGTDQLRYTIVRNGREIGTHRVRFETQPEGYEVQVETLIQVKVLFIPVFTYDYRSTEFWCGRSLQQVHSKVVDNGKRATTQFSRRHDSQSPLPPLLTTNHWNAEVVSAPPLFNTITGQWLDVTVLKGEEEWVEAGANARESRRYEITGDLDIEVWYDSRGRWSRLRFQGQDGVDVEFVCEQCGAQELTNRS